MKRSTGLISQDGSGTGLALAQNYISAGELDIDRYTVGVTNGSTISPARPGQTLIAWATGLGPIAGADNQPAAGGSFISSSYNVQVIVGGVAITPVYAGRAPGGAGEDQINFALPSNVPAGCEVTFQVSVNGAISNPLYISIAPDQTSQACVYPGLTAAPMLTR